MPRYQMTTSHLCSWSQFATHGGSYGTEDLGYELRDHLSSKNLVLEGVGRRIGLRVSIWALRVAARLGIARPIRLVAAFSERGLMHHREGLGLS